tara:strand:- start:49 stop:1020 length:972 start_codon:yes stop_codon:yes gene_type:complete
MLNFLYKYFLRKILFLLNPETAHKVVESLLYLTPNKLFNIFFKYNFSKDTSTVIFGNNVPSPVGIAAGLDKDYKSTPKYLSLGFGFSVVGTTMINPRKGNPKPRLIREKSKGELVNALSFPSDGSYKILNRLKNYPSPRERIIISVSGTSEEEIIENLLLFQDFCFAVEINISSPNTTDLKKFVNHNSIRSILKKSRKVTNLPIFIKLPRLLEIEYYDELIKATQEFDQVGVVLCNTLPVTDSRLSVGNGGRSGKSLFDSTLSILKYVRKSFPEITILCSGGISSPDQAKMLLESGANALQIYTALIYEGPGIIKEINDNLSN